MVTTFSQKVNSVKVFLFSSQMWCDCKQQPHLQSLFHNLLNDESTCVFSIWWPLMEDCSSSSIQSFQSVVAWKMFILHGCKGEGATEQQMSWILIFFFYIHSIYCMRDSQSFVESKYCWEVMDRAEWRIFVSSIFVGMLDFVRLGSVCRLCGVNR